MSSPQVVLSVEHASESDVRSALIQFADIRFSNDGSGHALGFGVDVANGLEEAEYAQQYLQANNLEDENPVWRELDARAFPVEVRVYAHSGTVWVPCIEMIGDALARLLSESLQTRIVLSVGDGYVPFGIYSSGAKIRDFADHYERLFQGREWIPSSLR